MVGYYIVHTTLPLESVKAPGGFCLATSISLPFRSHHLRMFSLPNPTYILELFSPPSKHTTTEQKPCIPLKYIASLHLQI